MTTEVNAAKIAKKPEISVLLMPIANAPFPPTRGILVKEDGNVISLRSIQELHVNAGQSYGTLDGEDMEGDLIEWRPVASGNVRIYHKHQIAYIEVSSEPLAGS